MRAIRTASMADLTAVAAVEAACFPAAEAATEADFAKRLAVYPEHFWLLEDDDGNLISFVNGMNWIREAARKNGTNLKDPLWQTWRMM